VWHAMSIERAPICRGALAPFKLPQGAPYLPLTKCFTDDNVGLRSLKLQKFRYRCIELCSHVRSPSLLPHGHPSALKRSKSAFLFVVYIPPAANAAVLALLPRPILPGSASHRPAINHHPRRNEGQQNAVCLSVLYLFDQKFLEMAPMMHKTATKQLNA